MSRSREETEEQHYEDVEDTSEVKIHHPRLDSVLQYFDSVLLGGTLVHQLILVLSQTECLAWQPSTPVNNAVVFCVEDGQNVVILQDPFSTAVSSSGCNSDSTDEPGTKEIQKNDDDDERQLHIRLLRDRFITCLTLYRWITVFNGDIKKKIWSTPLLAPQESTDDLEMWSTLRKQERSIFMHLPNQDNRYNHRKRKECICISCIILCFFFFTFSISCGLITALVTDSRLF